MRDLLEQYFGFDALELLIIDHTVEECVHAVLGDDLPTTQPMGGDVWETTTQSTITP